MSSIKRVIAIIIIISIIIILDIIIQNNTKNIISQMNANLENIDDMIENGENASEKIEETIKEWEEKEKIMSYYMEHDELEKIGSNIYLIQKQVKIEAFDEARTTISEVQFLFDHIEQKQLLNLENFF